MERHERLGRLLELVIPGGREEEIEKPQSPCDGCITRPNSDEFMCYCTINSTCQKHITYLGEMKKLDDQKRYIWYDYMKLAIRKFHIRHTISKDGTYLIPNTEEVRTILNLFWNRWSWRQKTNPIVPLLYKRSDATWKAIKVTLAMAGVIDER